MLMWDQSRHLQFFHRYHHAPRRNCLDLAHLYFNWQKHSVLLVVDETVQELPINFLHFYHGHFQNFSFHLYHCGGFVNFKLEPRSCHFYFFHGQRRERDSDHFSFLPIFHSSVKFQLQFHHYQYIQT